MTTPINKESLLENVKIELGLTDNYHDNLLNELIRKVLAHFYLEYENQAEGHHDIIIQDVVVRQFNRNGSEGFKTERQDGYSVTYEEIEYDFAKYDHILRKEFELTSPRTGGVKFI